MELILVTLAMKIANNAQKITKYVPNANLNMASPTKITLTLENAKAVPTKPAHPAVPMLNNAMNGFVQLAKVPY